MGSPAPSRRRRGKPRYREYWHQELGIISPSLLSRRRIDHNQNVLWRTKEQCVAVLQLSSFRRHKYFWSRLSAGRWVRCPDIRQFRDVVSVDLVELRIARCAVLTAIYGPVSARLWRRWIGRRSDSRCSSARRRGPQFSALSEKFCVMIGAAFAAPVLAKAAISPAATKVVKGLALTRSLLSHEVRDQCENISVVLIAARTVAGTREKCGGARSKDGTVTYASCGCLMIFPISNVKWKARGKKVGRAIHDPGGTAPARGLEPFPG